MYVETNGRVLKFLNDDCFTSVKNTLDVKMNFSNALRMTYVKRSATLCHVRNHRNKILELPVV
jgi:hypothetical protein